MVESQELTGGVPVTPNVEAIKEWIHALRSGNFTQGSGSLFSGQRSDTPQYCCLGVACEVYKKITGGGMWNDIQFTAGGWADSSATSLPPSVKEFFGFDAVDPRLNGRRFYAGGGNGALFTCIGANDSARWTFSQIADALEERYVRGVIDDERKVMMPGGVK